MSRPLRLRQHHRLNLEIAGLRFAIDADSSDHARWIGVGCRRFVTSAGGELELAIAAAPKARSRGRDRLAWHGSCWTLETPTFRIAQLERGRFHAESGPRVGWGDLLRTWFALVLAERGGVLLHAAGVVRSGRALLFSGPSGSGKTTIARLAPPEAVLSDECVALRPDRRGDFAAHPTPFFGEMVDAAAAGSAPLGRIFLIDPKLRPDGGAGFRVVSGVPPGEAMAALLAQTFLRTLERRMLERLLPAIQALAGAVPVERLVFSPDPGIWSFVDARRG